ncbi:hypothetical protein J4E89_002471 [Alternaria sp. Ai002NY15]|nr:hypothetical protein J4E89_002471 [Alternaria sp. Ai002NY15]
MNLSFVKGEHLNIDAGFFAGTWKVHNKWLTWEGAHDQAFCEEDQSSGRELFSCDHAVLQLWDIMISQLMANGEHPQVIADERWLKSMARSRLLQMPRSVECAPTEKKGELIVTDDDEMGDNGSLYQPPSISSPLSVPMAPPSPPAPPSPKAPPMRRQPIRVNLAKKPKEDLYALGNKVEHKSLDWGGSFPGSHDFYRTRDKPDQEIYILKPKANKMKPRHKRMQSGPQERGSAKKSRTGTVAERAAPPPYIVLSSPEPEDDVDTPIPRENIAVRSGRADITPLPDKGIVYRY